MNKWGGKKYLIETKPGFVYVRKGGRYIGRVTAAYPSPEFDRQYWEILTGRKVSAKTSWTALIKSYRASDRWTNLKQGTRRTYERVLIYIEEKNGPKDMTRLQRKDVIAAQSANRHRAKFANDVAAVMSVLCEHAIDIGWLTMNPAKGVRKIQIPKERQKPHKPWTDAAVEAWRAQAQGQASLIFEIGVGSVQRPGDWVDFVWGDYDGECLELHQNKTDKALQLPCTDHLKAALDRAKADLGFAPHPSRPILTTKSGGKMTYDYMVKIMVAERKRLGLMDYDQHALRYRGVMELAWADCDDDEIMSYSGHSTKAMVIKYAGLARQIMRAKTASEKRRLWAQA
ncbi:MAG: integrase [Rhodobacteraceae bacterium]|nr:integrase [Paracoccaceae bacterium]MAY47149.1 integrase [Paracoccaceae bacterium]